MTQTRRSSSHGSWLLAPSAVFLGGAGLLCLAPFACSLDTSGSELSGGPESTSSTASTGAGPGSGGSGGGASSSTSGSGSTTGSTGSAGGMGGAGGAGGGGGAGPTHEWTAMDPTLSSGGGSPCAAFTYTLPEWLTFESPTEPKSSQTSESSLCVGFGAHAPRARNVSPGGGADTWGLSVESARTNTVHNSASWNVGWEKSPNDPLVDMAFAPGTADPAGGFNATTFISSGNQHSRYFNANGRVASTWAHGEGPAAGAFAHFRHKNIVGSYKDVLTTVWRRLSVVHGKDESDSIVLETRDVPAGAGAITAVTTMVAYGAQVEPGGQYPSSYIPTMEKDVTRAAEKLFSTQADKLLPGGFLNLTMRLAPNFASDEQQVGEYDIFFIEGKHRLFLRKSDHKIVLKINGQDTESASLTFSREQPLTIKVKHQQGTDVELTVEGAMTGNGTVTGAPKSALATDKPIYLLGNNGGAEECSDLRYIKFE